LDKLNYAAKVNSIKNTGEVILQSLMEMIYEGKLKPGQSLKQEEIADLFKVSRVPVRDAFQKLIEVGLAVKVPRRGIMVVDLSTDRLRKLYEVRIILESVAIKLVMCNINDEILNELKFLIKKQKIALKYKNIKDAIQIDDEFHNVLYNKDILLNDVLSELIYSIRLRIKHARDLARYKGELKDWLNNSIRRHSEIYEAILSKDKNYAKKIIVKIVNESKQEVFNSIKNMNILNN